MKVLVITRDAVAFDGLHISLAMRWPQAVVISCRNGTEGIRVEQDEHPDLTVIDSALPDLKGLDVLQRIRSKSTVPVIMIADTNEEMDRVRALELGADDYIPKPLSFMEFVARVKALLRRCNYQDAGLPVNLNHGSLSIDFRTGRVRLKDKEIHLTPMEYNILCELVMNMGRIVPNRTFIEKLWGEQYLDTPCLIKVHIHRLRRKLGDNAAAPQFIACIPGRGYRFSVPAQASLPAL